MRDTAGLPQSDTVTLSYAKAGGNIPALRYAGTEKTYHVFALPFSPGREKAKDGERICRLRVLFLKTVL